MTRTKYLTSCETKSNKTEKKQLIPNDYSNDYERMYAIAYSNVYAFYGPNFVMVTILINSLLITYQ